ncbi:M14 family zinc carboxypeptidase [Sphingosinicella rhizophila]|uniref:Peptidase M14 domain-containing protein n=1 Tax=Sphingosinicella rhizophila TaxID=3050082 RepID=A0ABU3Q9W1_9SPHN|nr:M14 family zinc carboxypeptidase [Sphingosinicella sp. GR2756]MDT9600200.1 hypothetical protein [Sphingosinicella sp. GR2756]
MPTGSAINIDEALHALPHYDKFCSVAELDAFAEELRGDPRFTVEVAGSSEKGAPIYHVRFGRGSLKAMLVGSIHCNEPIGGITVHGLMSLLRQGHPAVAEADVEWHIIPCIDPDGAKLNEGWTQQPFDIRAYMKGFHVQELGEQVDMTFPVQYKDISFDQPVPESRILMRLLDEVRPDFYYPLHNALAGGAFYVLKHDIGRERYQAFYDLLEESGLPLEQNIFHKVMCDEYGESVLSMPGIPNFYEFYAKSGAPPAEFIKFGETSSGYLASIKPQAQSLVVELPYLKHPITRSQKDTGESLRQLKIRQDADNKFIVTEILTAWDKVKDDLDADSALYRKVKQGTVASRDLLHEGMSASPEKTRDLLYNPSYGRTMTESERFTQHVMRLYMMSHVYEFVRLLKASQQTERVRQAIARLEPVFDELLDDIACGMDAERLEMVDHDTLARIMIGTGLVVLDAMLADRAE